MNVLLILQVEKSLFQAGVRELKRQLTLIVVWKEFFEMEQILLFRERRSEMSKLSAKLNPFHQSGIRFVKHDDVFKIHAVKVYKGIALLLL